MIPLYGRPPTTLERFKDYFTSRSPYWLIKFFRFLAKIVEIAIRFVIGLFQEAIRTFQGKY